MVVYLLKEYNIDHYVKSKTVCYHCCWTWDTPEAQDLYKMLVHTTHETFIHRIIYISLPSLGSKWSWQCLLKPKTPWNVMFRPQNGNEGNCAVSQQFLTSVCVTSPFYWTLYLMLFNFLWLNRFIFFAWSITQFLRDELDKCFWNYLAILMYYFLVELCIVICLS